MTHIIKNKLFYNFFRFIIGFFGAFIGVIVGLTLLYPIIIAFPNKLFIVIFEIYLVIFLAIGFYRLFDIGFSNYINYKSIFKNNGIKIILQRKNFAIAFYIFGIILFIYFILSF